MFFLMYRYSLIIFCSIFIGACTVTAKVWTPYDKISITALNDVNPDGKDQPSPIQLKIYQLSSRSTFDNLDFGRAFYKADTLLSDQLLQQDELIFQPGETIKHEINLEKKVKFIAIIAGFIDIDNSRWKHIYKVKPHGHYNHYITLSDRFIGEEKPPKEDDRPPSIKELKQEKEALQDSNLKQIEQTLEPFKNK